MSPSFFPVMRSLSHDCPEECALGYRSSREVWVLGRPKELEVETEGSDEAKKASVRSGVEGFAWGGGESSMSRKGLGRIIWSRVTLGLCYAGTQQLNPSRSALVLHFFFTHPFWKFKSFHCLWIFTCVMSSYGSSDSLVIFSLSSSSLSFLIAKPTVPFENSEGVTELPGKENTSLNRFVNV